MSGIGEEMGDVGMAIQRAEDKTAQMQARAGAIDELIASGALDDASSLNAGDDISRELEAMSSQSDVEAELAKLKAAKAPEAIEAGQGGEILEAEPQTTTESKDQT
jgi:phage shock protein A